MPIKISSRTAKAFLPLFAVVALAGCVSQGAYDRLQSENDQLKTQSASMAGQIQMDKAQISRLQGAIKYTVNSDLLFPSGGWKMSDRGKQIIAAMAKNLVATQENHIVVNGYTDNAPVGARLVQQGITSNEILSQKRADNVMDFLIAQGLNPELVSAHGMGDADPIASNKTSEGRSKNRRVELTLGSPS